MPIHDELPGWKEDISQARSFEELPENARDYVKHITEVTDVEVALVSVGRQREQTLVVRPELLGKRKKRSVGRGH